MNTIFHKVKQTLAVDARTFVFLLATAGVVASLFLAWTINFHPSEDAAILFRYVENLVNFGVISYNPNGQPVEGSTDFLWLVLLSLLHFVGLPIFVSAGVLSSLGLLFTAGILSSLYEKPIRQSIAWWVFFVAFLMVMPMTAAAFSGFSNVFFGAVVALMLYCFVRNRMNWLFLSGLLLCLLRPDGVFFAAPLVGLSIVLHKKLFPGQEVSMRKLLGMLVVLAIIPGVLYFLWRWWYFGHLFPLPFYVKFSEVEEKIGIFYQYSLWVQAKILIRYAPLVLFVLYSVVRSGGAERRKTLVLIVALILVPFLCYSFFALTQNVHHRFQYPMVLSLLLISVYCLRRYERRIALALLTVQLSLILPFSAKVHLANIREEPVIQNVAKDLGNITRDAKMLVADAGWLPYYSKWYTEDMWGLNTAKYARRLIQTREVRALNADLIELRADLTAAQWGAQRNGLDLEASPEESRTKTHKNLWHVIAGEMERYTPMVLIPKPNDPEALLSRVFCWLEEQSRRVFGGKYRQYHVVFFVLKDFKFHAEVMRVLRQHGAVDWDTFKNWRASKKQVFGLQRQCLTIGGHLQKPAGE